MTFDDHYARELCATLTTGSVQDAFSAALDEVERLTARLALSERLNVECATRATELRDTNARLRHELAGLEMRQLALPDTASSEGGEM